MRRLIFFVVLMACASADAQVSPEKLTGGQTEAGKWSKFGKAIRKSLVRDTLNPEGRYLFALYFFNPSQASFNIDSAFHYTQGSIRNYRLSPLQLRDKLRKVPLDSAILFSLKERIDSAAFERAKKINTVEAYQDFIRHFSTASQKKTAVELRDEVAFLEALKVNTWTSFRNFLDHYPESHRKHDAQIRYNKLLYEDKTRDGKLSSYERFVKDYPLSPYRSDAEKNIFELSTLTGSPGVFRQFIKNYAGSRWKGVAGNILYGILETSETETFPEAWMTDSLKNAEKANRFYWLPVFKSGLFGFMDEKGSEVIPPRFQSVSDDYLCGNVTASCLQTSEGLIGRNGAVIVKGSVQGAEELGLGFLLVTVDSCRHVVHESGYKLKTDEAGAAKVLANRFLAVQKNGKWSIRSFTGRILYSFLFDEAEAYDTLIFLTRNGKKYITTPERLVRNVLRNEGESLVFDDVRRWSSQQYWVRNGLLEGVLDARLNLLIPLDRQILKKTSFGFLSEKERKLYVNGIKKLEGTPFISVTEQANWVRAVELSGRYILFEKTFNELIRGDSAWFQGPIAFKSSGDSVSAYLPSSQKITFHSKSVFRLVESRDSTAWLVLDEKKRKVVYDAASGLKVFSVEADQVEPVANKIFLVTRSGKKGLMAEDGKLLLPIEYDAIIVTDEHSFSLLKEKKFGWYDASSRQLLKPVYERNVKSYNKHYKLAFREKGYAFIRHDGTPVGNFEWEDFQYWNDTTAWVKKDFQWHLLFIASQRVRLDKIRSFTTILDSPTEKIFCIRQDNAFGIISNRRGLIVPLKYSDIVNLGTPEIPMYFTERHIEEAGISVVVYYDQHGKIVRRQAMEAEEFDRIYCDN